MTEDPQYNPAWPIYGLGLWLVDQLHRLGAAVGKRWPGDHALRRLSGDAH